MTAPVRVAVVAHSLNHNNIGRVYPFLQAFVGSPDVSLTLIGWDATGTLFSLLRTLPWPIVRLAGAPGGLAAERQLAGAVEGHDLIHCFKNREHLPAALRAAQARGMGLVLDLDDWELGLYLEGVAAWPRWRQLVSGGPIARRIRQALELERLARSGPNRLVVNSRALQAHFGGELAYTAADADALDPARADGAGFRRAHGLAASAPVIGFLGTPHPHKGIDELLAAFGTLRNTRPDARLLFVGVPAHNPYYGRLVATPGVAVADYIGADDYRDAYAACDAVAVPQRAVTEGIVQTPAKLILAMAAARPIVATRVGDMPEILGDAGVLIAPEDSVRLGAALGALLDDPARRSALGAAARERFLARFTLAQLRERMLAVYRGALSDAQSSST